MDFAITWPASVLAISNLTLRIAAPYFVRWLPLGPRFTPLIYTSSVLYFTTFIVNLLCLLVTVDFVYRNHVFYNGNELSFSRVGYVDSSSARVVIRAPLTLTVQIEYRLENIAQWTPGQVLSSLPGNHDNVLTFALTSLEENASYVYRTNASHIGSFRTSLRNPKRWSMVTTSCIKPFYPYNPFDHSLRIPGLEYLSRFVSLHNVDFVLFLGDFIYIDLPHRFGWTTGDYYEAYRQVYSSPSWSSELFDLPWLHIYDDHEITNDWSGNETGLYQDAIKPYLDYQQAANPPPLRKGATYYSFTRGDVSFFVTDTRRYRSSSAMDDGPGKTMLGETQRRDLESWLETENVWKVIVSGVPFTRNWRGPEANDSWAGYLWERQLLLEKMWKTDGVVILSGDRHEHATTLFPSPDGKSKVIEFSTSPLSQFYQPFERRYQQIENTDVALYSHPYGISKFGSLTFDTSSPDIWTLGFELVINGMDVWNYNWTLSRTRQ
ncbi:PhoD-like phosphatase-domain-containing protein [Lipomyces orientalis]|uniref:PhoD-like phosphatase-domain-containing protein n=1 Tax=Lipomyces orientalis TaxID=1233043 RepID=A0ACC3TD99_9ASCO